MKTSPAGTQPTIFDEDPGALVPIAKRRSVKDPVGMWYAARKHYGQDDRMWFGVYRNNRPSPQWHTCSHRYCDGLGAISLMLQEKGLPDYRPPVARPAQMPDWRTLWRSRKGVPGPEIALKWKYLEPGARSCVSHLPVSILLSEAQTDEIEKAAAAMGVSSTVWLLWTADRALRATLADAGSVTGWVYPVNLRGSVRNVDVYANHCSGLVLRIEEGNDAQAVKRQIRERFDQHEHWRQWVTLSMGKWVGQGIINFLYRLVQAEPGRYAGSYSNLGEWNIPGFDGLICSAPGSPAYPVSVSTVLCNGRRALACRLHPVIGGDTRQAIALLKIWRELSVKPLIEPAQPAREPATV